MSIFDKVIGVETVKTAVSDNLYYSDWRLKDSHPVLFN